MQHLRNKDGDIWSNDRKGAGNIFQNHSPKTEVLETFRRSIFRDLWNIFNENSRNQRNFCFSGENF